MKDNGRDLAKIVKKQARSFGADKVHLVAHSKGGLDSRRYLADHYNPDEVKVLSLHTLSTPHHGSILADLSVTNRTVGDAESSDPDVDDYLDKDWWLDALGQGPQMPGLRDLQTSAARTFNATTQLPPGVKFYTYGADADLDNNGEISVSEVEPLIPDNLVVDAAGIGSLLYRLLRDVSSISVTRMTNLWGLNSWDEVTPRATVSSEDNDLSVTDFSSRHPSQVQHFGPLDQNHSTIKDDSSLSMVLSRIRADFPMD